MELQSLRTLDDGELTDVVGGGNSYCRPNCEPERYCRPKCELEVDVDICFRLCL
jgi:hypothetical protein